MAKKGSKKEEKRKLKVEITPLIKRIEALTKRIVRTKTLGEYISIFKGAGLEFDGYRQYTTDMDASRIDWKASVRSRSMLIKVYREIRDLHVYFVFDVSESMVFGSTEKLKNEYAVEFALALAYTILGAGDAVGLITFSDNIIHRFKAAKGTQQFYKMAKVLLDPTLYGGGYNLANTAEFVLNFVERKNSLVIVVSDFYGSKGASWKRKLKLMSAKFDTVCLVVRDPRDKSLPEDVKSVLVEDPFTGDRLLIDSALLKQRYETYVRQQDKELFNYFKEVNIDGVELVTDKPLVRTLLDFFITRRRKLA